MTRLESILRKGDVIVIVPFIAATLLAWTWILTMSVDMYGSMTGASAWAMRTQVSAEYVALLLAMWSVMMAGMMLPSASPFLLLYAGVVRRSAEAAHTAVRVYLLALGYLLVWVAFSGVATVGQLLMAKLWLVSPMMQLANHRLSAAAIIVAGIYQFSPVKGRCLENCRSPVEHLTRHWSPGNTGAFRMGLRHGVECLGCCWALMLLLFAGGVMNAYVIGALTLFVAIEKITPMGVRAARIGGALLLIVGAWMAVWVV
jgi:predicted metal-binding membrane protein